MIKRIFSPRGRITAREFLIGLAVFAVGIFIAQFLLGVIGNNMWGFFLWLTFVFLFFQGLYGLYGKRLHDMGRTFWPLTGMLSLMLIAIFVVGMIYGMADYISTFAQYDRNDEIDPAVIEAAQAEYQARMEGGSTVLAIILWGIAGAFTLWMAIGKSDPEENLYGPPPRD